MRIAVIADTHDKLPIHVLAAVREADQIWHLGDVTTHAILDTLRATERPLRFVRGNCDFDHSWPLSLAFEIEGFRIQLIHIPPPFAGPGMDLLFHGHTHVPRNELVGSTRFYNPGCITRPNRGAPASFAWLQLERGKPADWTLVKV
jgi:predicted phosphodiesterase